MDKDHQEDGSRQAVHEDIDHEFKSDSSTQNLIDKLRNAHLSLKEYVSRCQTDLKTPGYIPNVTLLEDPEKQKVFRGEYIK
jgi:hypothetical protein